MTRKFFSIVFISLLFLTACMEEYVPPEDTVPEGSPEWMVPRSTFPETLDNTSIVTAYAIGRLSGCQVNENKIIIAEEETGWAISCRGRSMVEHHIDKEGVWVKQSELVGNPT